MSPKETAYIVDRLAVRFMSMVADYERKIVEHRDSFGARTKADAKIIEGLRAAADEQVLSASKVAYVLRCAGETPVQAAQRVVKERDGLLTQAQDQRAEMERLREDERKAHQAGVSLRAEVAQLQSALNALQGKIREMAESLGKSLDERDALRAEVAELKTQLERLTSWAAKNQAARETLQNEIEKLKSQSPHPVKVGEWVKASNGAVAQVLEVHKDWYLIARGHGWTFANCEPCDPPSHDTEAGKAVAESAVRTEPVAEEIKVGDVAKVVGASGDLTAQSDIGKIGEVLKIDFGDGTVLLSGAGWVNRCDVRKVTT